MEKAQAQMVQERDEFAREIEQIRSKFDKKIQTLRKEIKEKDATIENLELLVNSNSEDKVLSHHDSGEGFKNAIVFKAAGRKPLLMKAHHGLQIGPMLTKSKSPNSDEERVRKGEVDRRDWRYTGTIGVDDAEKDCWILEEQVETLREQLEELAMNNAKELIEEKIRRQSDVTE